MNASQTPTTAALNLRPKLLAVAYRMLGNVADAEDAVQDAYVRLQQTPGVAAPEGWLVKTTTRLCIDRLRKERRRERYHGPWLPEPVPNQWDGAQADPAETAESLSMAFLVLLETLSPAERAAYLLREVFGYEFDEIAELLDKTPVNVRQITARAKKRLDAKERRFRPDVSRAEDLAGRFFAACRSGDLQTVEALLADEVVLHSDGGGKVHAAPRPVTGRHRVANLLAVVFRKLQQLGELSLTTVNGQPGAVFVIDGRVTEIFTFSADGDRVKTIYAVLNPDKLARWPTAVEAGDRTSINPRRVL